MEILLLILIGGTAVLFMVRQIRKSLKEGDQCQNCGLKDPCNKRKCP